MVAVAAAAFIAAGASILTTGFTKGGNVEPLDLLKTTGLAALGGAVGGLAAGPALGAASSAGTAAGELGGMGLGGAGGGALGGAPSIASSVSAASLAGGGASELLSSLSTSSFLGAPAASAAAQVGAQAAQSPEFFSGIGFKDILQAGTQLAKPILAATQGGIDAGAPLPPQAPALVNNPPQEQVRDYERSPEAISASNRRRIASDQALAEQRAEEELGKVNALVSYRDKLDKTGKGRLLTDTTSSQRLSGIAGVPGRFR